MIVFLKRNSNYREISSLPQFSRFINVGAGVWVSGCRRSFSRRRPHCLPPLRVCRSFVLPGLSRVLCRCARQVVSVWPPESPCVLGWVPARPRPLVGRPRAQPSVQGLKEQAGLPSTVVWRHRHSALTARFSAAASAQEVAAVATDSGISQRAPFCSRG